MSASSLHELQDRLGYHFGRIDLLRQALTHKSVSHDVEQNLEALEALGDAWLDFVVVAELHQRNPVYTPQDLTWMKNFITCDERLADFGSQLDLRRYLIVGRSVRSDDPLKNTVADVVEAICAAIYKDAGPVRARAAILCLFAELIETAQTLLQYGIPARSDWKNQLQKFLQQQRPQPVCEYRHTRPSGEPHEPTFTSHVVIDGVALPAGQGRTKRAAELAAAREALLAVRHSGQGRSPRTSQAA